MRPATRRIVFGLGPLGWLFLASGAQAQTWVDNRPGPALTEILTVDRTGEDDWLWGREDIAGDGLDRFAADEQALDARTVYVTTDDQLLYARLYVSSTSEVSDELTVYLFIDNDRDADSGGGADVPAIDPSLTEDPTPGGYEFLVGFPADGSAGSAWEYDLTAREFTPMSLEPADIVTETGTLLDPLRIGNGTRAYAQVVLPLTAVGLTSACQARLFVRTTNRPQDPTDGDLDVGEVAECRAADRDRDSVPDPVQPDVECSSDSQCPNGGICWDGRCLLSAACSTDRDCASGYSCEEGRCVVTPGASCNDSADCDGLVCENGRCAICTASNDCERGQVCQPDGRCVDEDEVTTPDDDDSELVLEEGERVQGGACTCRTSTGRSSSSPLWWLLGCAVLGWRRFSREQV